MVRRNFVIKKIKYIVPWTYVISDVNGEEIVGTFYEKMQKTNQTDFRVAKVMKRNEDKLYVRWKGYDDSFNSWIDKKDIVKTKTLGKFESGIGSI